MFNLLPQIDRQAISREYRLRLTATGLFFFSLLCLVAIISLIPSLFLAIQIDQDTKRRVDILDAEVAVIAKDNPIDALVSATKKVEAIQQFSNNKSNHDLIDHVTGSVVPGIKIIGFDINKSDNGIRDMNIFGQAADRESLSAFAKVLENSKLFSAVVVPVSNFAPSADIKFSISAKVDEPAVAKVVTQTKKTTEDSEE